MEKVYIVVVEDRPYDEDEMHVLSVFTTLELAKAEISKLTVGVPIEAEDVFPGIVYSVRALGEFSLYHVLEMNLNEPSKGRNAFA